MPDTGQISFSIPYSVSVFAAVAEQDGGNDL